MKSEMKEVKKEIKSIRDKLNRFVEMVNRHSLELFKTNKSHYPTFENISRIDPLEEKVDLLLKKLKYEVVKTPAKTTLKKIKTPKSKKQR